MKNKIIGNNIKYARQCLDMTQQQLAEAANLSVTHIAHLECGYTSLSIDSLLTLCDKLYVTPNELLAGLYPTGRENDEKMLYETAKSLTKQDQDLILDIAALMTKHQKLFKK